MFSGNARTTFSLMVYIQTSLDPDSSAPTCVMPLEGPVKKIWCQTISLSEPAAEQAPYVSIGDHVSDKHDSCFGVAQGSCFGPLLFSLYMQQLGDIIRAYNVCFNSYGDDTQLYIAAEPNDDDVLWSITKCLSALHVSAIIS